MSGDTTPINASDVRRNSSGGIGADLINIPLAPGRVVIQVRSPESDKPEATIAYDETCLIVPMQFDQLRLLTRQCQEALMRYPVEPKPAA
jgi:hypothetical protein